MIGCLIIAGVSFASSQDLNANLAKILANPKLDGGTVCACVTDLDGNVLFAQNERTRVMPASNQKLLSAAFALWELGPNFAPTTSFWKEPSRVYVESNGDPLLAHDDLISVAHTLDLNRSFPVYVKEAYAPGFPGGWELEDLPNKFAAPISAFTVDRGSFSIWNKGGQPRLLPEAYGVRIQRGDELHYDPFLRVVTVPKVLPKKDSQLDTLSLPRSDEAAALILGSRFVPSSNVPTRPADIILKGKPLGQIIAACLPPSDNNIAENLLLMGAAHLGTLGHSPYPQARTALANFLERVVAVPQGDVLPYDGSGMSKENVLTTRALARLLVWANQQTTTQVWRNALAHSGARGTLSGRLSGITFSGKTGSLNRVVALSGYVRTATGKEVVMSLVMNNFSCSSNEARGVEDQFVRELSRWAP